MSVEDLGLHGDIERRGRLVGDDELGLAGERHRDHDPLALPAAQPVRVVGQAVGRGVEPDIREQLDAAPVHLGLGQAEVDPQRLGDLLADREDRVEGGERLLKDHADAPPADRLHGPVVQLQQVAPAEADAAGREALGRPGDEAQHGQG